MPFTAEEFLGVFAAYNTAIWPMQLVLLFVAVTAVAIALYGRSSNQLRVAPLLLGLLWLWSGAVYHLRFFGAVNPAAKAFGILFLAQGMLLCVAAIRGTIVFEFRRARFRTIGLAIAAYGLVVYPVVGWLLGHRYPSAPTPGAPCPVAILTIGLLLLSRDRIPMRLLIIPLIWATIATSAALSFGMLEDLGLSVAAVVAAGLVGVQGRKRELRHA